MNENLIPSSNVVRVTKNNFIGHGWEKDQVMVVNGSNITSPETDFVRIECAERNTNEPGLNKGSVLLSLPTSANPSLRRVRLRNTLHHGLRLADINKFLFHTFIISNLNDSSPALALQIDLTGDNVSEFNIFFDPTIQNIHNSSFSPVRKNEWQQWDALNGVWQLFNITRPELPVSHFTLQTFLSVDSFKNARIINTTTGPNSGGGIRFTVGGSTTDYNDFKGYIDAFVVGINGNEKLLLYDFICDNAEH
jgi:hypothetical protein